MVIAAKSNIFDLVFLYNGAGKLQRHYRESQFSGLDIQVDLAYLSLPAIMVILISKKIKDSNRR